MHDEASPSYVDMIDQTSLGHRLIIQEFGVGALPRVTGEYIHFVMISLVWAGGTVHPHVILLSVIFSLTSSHLPQTFSTYFNSYTLVL